MRTKLRLIIALLTFALVAAMPLSQAWASSGDLDEILAYDITVDVNDLSITAAARKVADALTIK